MHSEKIRTKLVKSVTDSHYFCDIKCTEGKCDEILNYAVNLFVNARITLAIKMENRNFQCKGRSRNRKRMKLRNL